MTKELTQFKYEQLDESTADFLRQKESNMREIVGKAYTELGKELYEAQQELSKRGGKHEGVFGKWLQYIGMERRQATRLIQRYKLVIGTNCPEGEKLTRRYELVQNLHEVSVKERIEDITLSEFPKRFTI